jgi:hypothetical protein
VATTFLLLLVAVGLFFTFIYPGITGLNAEIIAPAVLISPHLNTSIYPGRGAAIQMIEKSKPHLSSRTGAVIMKQN